jgi:hypothetical protein
MVLKVLVVAVADLVLQVQQVLMVVRVLSSSKQYKWVVPPDFL